MTAFLPGHILILPDWDIIKHIGHYKYGFSIIAEKILQWLVTNISRAVESRKDDLANVKTGATVHSEPKLIWVATINRIGCYDKALSVRSKFNSILEDVLGDFDGHYIVNMSKKMSKGAFYSQHGITQSGATRYWLEIDKTLKELDMHDMSLWPLKARECPQNSFKMPPPPPERRWTQQSCQINAAFGNHRVSHEECHNHKANRKHRVDWHHSHYDDHNNIKKNLARFY